jgi:hypothetical protein
MTVPIAAQRVATAVLVVAAGIGVGRWLRDRRPAPRPITRCPLHGIAYDTDREMCPDCAKTGAAERPGKGDAR